MRRTFKNRGIHPVVSCFVKGKFWPFTNVRRTFILPFLFEQISRKNGKR